MLLKTFQKTKRQHKAKGDGFSLTFPPSLHKSKSYLCTCLIFTIRYQALLA